MMASFLEMGFSVEGLHPKGTDGIFTNREGFLHRKKSGKYIPLKPHLGNGKVMSNRGAYFYFDCNGKTYKVFQEEIEEFGLNAKAHEVK